MTLPARLAAILLVLALSGTAWGQGALLQGGPFTSGHPLMYSGPPGGSQAVVQDAGPAGGGSVGLGLSELLQVNRSPGTGPSGTHVALYDAPITSPNHFLSFDANANGGPTIAFGAQGGATPLPLQFINNGIAYQFPYTVGGIVGPVTTNINDIATWNNAVGSLQKTSGPAVSAPLVNLGTTPITAGGSQLLSTMDRTVTLTSLVGANVNYDAVSGIAVQPAGSTIVNDDGVAGYCLNFNISNALGQSCVGVFGWGLSKASNSNTWGLVGETTSLPGFINEGMFGAEIDVNVSNVSDIPNGISINGASTVTPTVSVGLAVNNLGIGHPWLDGVLTAAACCSRAMEIGALSATGVGVSGQIMQFDFIDNSGIGRTYTFQATPTALNFSGSQAVPTFQFGGNVLLAPGFVFAVGPTGGVSCNGTPTALFTSVGGIVVHC